MKKEILGKSRYSIVELKKDLGIITNDLHQYFLSHGRNLSGYEVVLSGFYASIGIYTHQSFKSSEKQKVKEVMEFLGISKLSEKRVSTMSTGELRKCIVARALIHKPKAFILDEPTVGLDIKAQIDFISMMRKLSKSSSIILVTHHLEEIFDEISHVALIADGTIYKQGKKDDILNSKDISYTFNTDIKIDKKNERYFIKEILN
jgi:iron complex transport system ATP-binding protein